MADKPVPAPAGRLLGQLFEPPAGLAPYATRAADSRGRFHTEEEDATRSAYQRDRDRIIHSAAFRRLKHKTQVFVHHEGDYYRTRLTHSLEVAQIARSVARVLALDEDLAEALALSHDLGHTPFGHAGEDALNAAMQPYGGFDHNAHALRIVTRLEARYAAFDGLNLTWETLEGLVKHNGPLRGAGRTHADLPEAIAAFDAEWPLDLASHAGLEAQIAALADDIAYVNHDIDDGLRAGLFSLGDLRPVPLAGPVFAAVADAHPGLDLGRLIGEGVRRLINAMVLALVAETRANLARLAPRSVADIRNAGAPVAALPADLAAGQAGLKQFLFERMYRHYKVNRAIGKARRIVTDLFAAMHREPGLLPPDWAQACGAPGDAATARVVSDYIAGMTDRFAVQEHRRIFRMDLEG